MISRVSIKSIAALTLALPVLLLGLWLSIMWNNQSREAVTELAESNLRQIHRLTSMKINDLLSIPPRVCEINERLVLDNVLDPNDLHAWWPIVSREFATFEMLSSIVWGSADGKALWIGRYSDGDNYWAVKDDGSMKTMQQWRLQADGSIPDEAPTTFDYNLFERPWFKSPVDAAAPAWTEPFVWAGGAEDAPVTLGISYGIPLYDDDGSLIGIVDADFSLNDLSAFLRTVSVGRTGMSVLFDAKGEILAISSGDEFINDDGSLQTLGEAGNPQLGAVDHLTTSIGFGAQFADSFEYDGTVYYAEVSLVGHELGLEWSLASIEPEQDFLAQIAEGFRRSSISSLIAVLLAILFGLLAARWLSKPLRTLVTDVRRIARGELDSHVDIRHASEYVELGHAINEMTSGLRDRIHIRERLEATTQSILDAIVTIDPQGRVVEFNRSAETMFGYERDAVMQQPMAELIIPPDLRSAHAAGMKHFKATGEGPVLNNRIEIIGMRSDETIFPIELTIVPFEFEGETYFTATIRDLTEAKQKQEQLEQSRQREDLLRRELDHRVKNMLAQIVALSRQTAERASSDRVLLDSLVGKITSLSSVHELLGECGQVSLQFEDLIDRCCQPYLNSDDQLDMSGPEILLRPQAAMCLSLICNELANNSRKHGALKSASGRIQIAWTCEGDVMTWSWTEHGGPPVPSDITPSFGMQMLQSLIPYELDGQSQVEFTDEGLVFESSIPIANITRND